MDIRTDFKNNLLDTDRIEEVEFEEYKNYSDNNRKHNENVDSDYVRQFGGKNDNLNYLDDYTSAQYNSKRLDSFEKEFVDMYNKAREFRQRIGDVENKQKNQFGGQDDNGEKKKRPLPPAIKLMQELTKIMRNTGKYPEIKQVQFIKISKMIVDDAKKQTGMQDVNETVRQAALQIVKNPEKYVERYKNESKNAQSDNKSSSNSRGNYSTSSNRSKNFRNDRSNQQESKDLDDTWKGYDSNFRNYAQADLWNDKNRSNKNSSNDYEINRYGSISYKTDGNDNDYQAELEENDYDVVDRVHKATKNNSTSRNSNNSKKRFNFMY